MGCLQSIFILHNFQYCIMYKGQKSVINQKLLQTNSKFTIGPQNKLKLCKKKLETQNKTPKIEEEIWIGKHFS